MTRLKLIGGALAALVVVVSHAVPRRNGPTGRSRSWCRSQRQAPPDRMGRLIAEELSKSFKQQFS